MDLTAEQIEKFKQLHTNGELDGLSDAEIRNLANGVANYFLTLFAIKQRINREKQVDVPVVPRAEGFTNGAPQGH
ncbi:MAG: hypothetical protein IT406_03385 [Candidatus Yanofskybacteria bacterium]|nr:hypothetical protein [Candidatus Yanofskybacteria bacterium]